ncbi:Uncharacterised protein [Streptococcus pneumoniae]|nr:Uncharacterised protein [Streptococcus pneumoniae]
MQNNPYVDGIVASSDQIAIELIRSARFLNIHIPDKLKIVGPNGSIECEWIGSSLPTIESYVKDNGKVAFQQLKGKIKK